MASNNHNSNSSIDNKPSKTDQLATNNPLNPILKKVNAKNNRNFIVIFLVTFIIGVIIIGWRAAERESNTYNIHSNNSRAVNKIISEKIEQGYSATDIMLKQFVERQFYQYKQQIMLKGIISNLKVSLLTKDLTNHLSLWASETPYISGIIVINKNGQVVFSHNNDSYKEWYKNQNLGDNNIIISNLTKNPDKSISAIIDNKNELINQKQFWVMARSLAMVNSKQNNEQFNGAIITLLDPEYFLSDFNSGNYNQGYDIALLPQNISDKTDNDKAKSINLPLSSSIYIDNLLHGSSMRSDLAREIIDYAGKRSRVISSTDETAIAEFNTSKTIYSLKVIKNNPLTLINWVDEETIMAEYWPIFYRDVFILITISTIIGIVSFFLVQLARQVNITKNAERRAVLASSAKSDFLAKMSHELRTPLNAIIGFSEMLQAQYFGHLNEKQKEYVTDIKLCGDHLLQLISDILDFSKGEAGKLVINKEEVKLNNIIEEALRMTSDKAAAGKIYIDTELEHEKIIMADRRKLLQIILNLLSNSIKFTPAEGRIKITTKINEQKQTTISVADTGCGIATADIPKVMQAFGQAHRNSAIEGTGLGLPLCKMLTEAHGGEFILNSEKGKGTNVMIILPAKLLME